MGRPSKKYVDYFPHDTDASERRTLFVIESNYGNNGYAFWFKLLELVGSSEGHVIDCSNPTKWEFLQAKTNLSEMVCKEILDLLARLDAIDQELWKKSVIWSQNFVDNIADVYSNRRIETPTKPTFYKNKLQLNYVSTDENPQTKLNQTKLNKSIKKGEESFKEKRERLAKKKGMK